MIAENGSKACSKYHQLCALPNTSASTGRASLRCGLEALLGESCGDRAAGLDQKNVQITVEIFSHERPMRIVNGV